MNTRNRLQCTFADAQRTTLLHGISLTTEAKIAFFEEMLSLAVKFNARDRLADRQVHADFATSKQPGQT